MNDFVIHITWEYFLGIMGSLIVIAWYSNGRFTKLETSVGLIEKGLKISMDNQAIKAFSTHSPVSLTSVGDIFISESGLKDYIDTNFKDLLLSCESKKDSNPYEVQNHIFGMFDALIFPEDVDNKIKEYAYYKGISTDTLRRVGAIYFRDICLKNFGMRTEDVDKHDPSISQKQPQPNH